MPCTTNIPDIEYLIINDETPVVKVQRGMLIDISIINAVPCRPT